MKHLRQRSNSTPRRRDAHHSRISPRPGPGLIVVLGPREAVAHGGPEARVLRKKKSGGPVGEEQRLPVSVLMLAILKMQPLARQSVCVDFGLQLRAVTPRRAAEV